MLFEFFPWDLPEKSKISSEGHESLLTFFYQDKVLGKMLQDELISYLNQENQVDFYAGKDLTVDMLESYFFTPSLFCNSSFSVIIESENLKKNEQKFILDKIGDLDLNTKILLSFSKRCKFYNELKSQKNKGKHFALKEVRFWEYDKLLNFFLERMNLKASYEVQDYIVRNVKNNSYELFNTLKQVGLSLSEGSNQLTIGDFENCGYKLKFDFFHLSSLFTGRQFKSFFKETLKQYDENRDEFLQFAIFMQSHMLKLREYLLSKDNSPKSRYEKTILSHSYKWNRKEIFKAIRLFSSLEVELKSNDPFVRERIVSFTLK